MVVNCHSGGLSCCMSCSCWCWELGLLSCMWTFVCVWIVVVALFFCHLQCVDCSIAIFGKLDVCCWWPWIVDLQVTCNLYRNMRGIQPIFLIFFYSRLINSLLWESKQIAALLRHVTMWIPYCWNKYCYIFHIW